MRSLRFALALASLGALTAAVWAASSWADDPAAKPAAPATIVKAELAKLQGTWECVSWVLDGERVPEREHNVESIYDGNQLTLKRQGQEYRHCLITIDASRTPKALNIWDLDGPLVDQTNRGIFEVKDDTLKVCIALDPEAERPTKFASEPASQTLNLVYQRRKP